MRRSEIMFGPAAPGPTPFKLLLLCLVLMPGCYGDISTGSFSRFIIYQNHPPQITVSPRPQVVRAGGVAYFICAARGDPAPVLRWYRRARSGAAGVWGERPRVLRPPGGGRLLRIESVRKGDDGKVLCVAENSAGDAVRAEAPLTVLDGSAVPHGFPMVSPSVSEPPTARIVDAGHAAVLPCSASGHPPPEVTWLKDGVPLQHRSHRVYIVLSSSSGATGSLNVSSARESDQGRYECVAENSLGSQISAPIQLYVKVRRVPPVFTTAPRPEVQVKSGGSVNLTCAATGSPVPTVHWRRDGYHGELLQGDQPQDFDGDLDEDDNELIAPDPRGGDSESQGKEDENKEEDYDEEDDDEEQPVVKSAAEPGRSILVLVDVRESANYTCTANSTLGTIHSTTRIRVQTLPGRPSGVKASDITSSSARLSWFGPPDEPREYVLQFRARGASGVGAGSGVGGALAGTAGAPYSEVTGVSTVYYSLRGLSPATRYEVRVVAINALGRGPPSEPLPLVTLHAEDSSFDVTHADEAPRGLQVRPLSSSTLLLQWEEPSTPSGPVTGYRVFYTTSPLLPLSHWSQQIVDDSRLSTVSGLTPHQVYWVRVQALTAVGPGSASPPALVKTQQGVPGSPSSFRLAAVSSSWAKLHWSPPSPLADKITSYELYWNDTYTRERHHISLPAHVTSASLQNLFPGCLYIAWVTAKSLRGEGAPTAPVAVRTPSLALAAPTDVRSWPINTTAVRVEWKAPQAIANITRGFLILVSSPTDPMDTPLEVEVGTAVTQAEAVGLQPDTTYTVRVAVLVRDTRGQLSDPPDQVTTHGGVPLRGNLHARFLSDTISPAPAGHPPGAHPTAPTLEVSWLMPPQTPGPISQFRLLYGPPGDPPKELFKGAADQRALLHDLERGVRYDFRLSGRSASGWGQDARLSVWTPDGAPAGQPGNVTARWQAAGVLALSWTPPSRAFRGGNMTSYTATVIKVGDPTPIAVRNTSAHKAVFQGLEEGIDYEAFVIAYNSRGNGPPSAKIAARVPSGAVRAPLKVGAAATTQHSIEVWWERLPTRGKVLGYQVLYTTTPVEDLDEWQHRSTGTTESVELAGLERLAEYAVVVGARTAEGLGRLSQVLTVRVRPTDVPVDLRATDVSTHSLTLTWSPTIQINPAHYKLSWDAVKLFVDAQGITQTQVVGRQSEQLSSHARKHVLDELQPFTTYRVNLTAVPPDLSYRPPAAVSVTTQMAAPQPMVQPALHGVVSGREIQVILPQASEQFGPISHYYLVVVPERPTALLPQEALNPDALLTSQLEHAADESPYRPYIAARFPQRNIPYSFHLGNNETLEGFRNKPLRPNIRYRIFIRAVVDTPQKHLYTSSPFSEPLSLSMRAAPPGDPPRRPDPSVPVERQGGVAVRGGAPGNSAGLVWLVGPLVAAITLCSILVAVFLFKRRRRPLKAPDCGSSCRPFIAADRTSKAPALAPSDPVEVRRMTCQTAAMLAHPPVPLTALASHVHALRDGGGARFAQEYESIEPGQTFTWDHSSMEVNRGKNRYANVVAYDHSRVVLSALRDVPGSDYINANYCDGYRRHNAYIATQGPLPNTFADFWRMVWETNASVIAMVTRLEERARLKCHQYWPERGSEKYGPTTVTALESNELAHYIVRTFSIVQDGCSSREIRQLQFTSWPDHGVPIHPAPFLLFLRRLQAARQLEPRLDAPVVVHCSAGVGRTGCLVVLDAMLERIRHENSVDVYGHVTCLRAQRNYMVQTEEQYMFIHDALLEAVQCGQTEVPARALQSTVQALEAPVQDGLTGMDLEFKRLNAMDMPGVTYSAASLEVNRTKNRLAHAVPYDHSRVILNAIGSDPGADYINASFVDGYRQRATYIATQGPLALTVAHFWRMVWQNNCAIVVMLTKLKEQGQDKCAQYWPAERALRYGNILVEPLAEYNLPSYTLREFKVSDDMESRTLRQFQLSDWPGDALIDFIGQVHKTKEQFGHDGPITVHCSGGVGRTGVFIALAVLLERMQWEGVLDVLGTVRLLRTQRPAMVSTLEQYRSLYRAALQYLGSFDHYAS